MEHFTYDCVARRGEGFLKDQNTFYSFIQFTETSTKLKLVIFNRVSVWAKNDIFPSKFKNVSRFFHWFPNIRLQLKLYLTTVGHARNSSKLYYKLINKFNFIHIKCHTNTTYLSIYDPKLSTDLTDSIGLSRDACSISKCPSSYWSKWLPWKNKTTVIFPESKCQNY